MPLKGCEFLKNTHGIGGAENRHGARQPDAGGKGRGGSQNDGRGGGKKLAPVMLTDTKDVQTDAIGGDDLLNEIGHSIGWRRDLTCFRIGKDGRKTVNTDFQENPQRLIGRWVFILGQVERTELASL